MSRIINRQRQLAEQGRLRLGYTVAATKRDGSPTTRPVRSETWILTSHARDLIEHAASLWGGECQEWEPMGNGAKAWRVITKTNVIPAILPPGDPLSQSYEQWNRGGCIRRCDGVTESFSGSPCICLATFGDDWYEKTPRDVCSSHSRLKVILPDMPGLGAWRMETGSYYATDEIAGMVDTIRGTVGETVLVPVQLRIEPRTRVAGGETKQFVVPVVELRGVTAGALLSGQAIETRQLRSGDVDSTVPLAVQARQTPAIEAPTQPAAQAVTIPSKEQLDAADAGLLTGMIQYLENHDLHQHPATGYARDRLARLQATAAPAPQQPDADGAVDADIVETPTPAAAPTTVQPDPDVVWQAILKEGGQRGMSLADVEDDVTTFLGGATSAEASGSELTEYLEDLQGRPNTAAGAA